MFVCCFEVTNVVLLCNSYLDVCGLYKNQQLLQLLDKIYLKG